MVSEMIAVSGIISAIVAILSFFYSMYLYFVSDVKWVKYFKLFLGCVIFFLLSAGLFVVAKQTAIWV